MNPGAAAPPWVWPALAAAAAAGAVGALLVGGSAPPAASPAGAPVAGPAGAPTAPPPERGPADARLSGVVSVDGVPSLALVVVDGRPALLRRGDPLDAAGGVVAAVEAQALVVATPGGATRRLPLQGPAVALSPPPASTAPASSTGQAMPALPPARYGAVPMPPQDDRAGTGNAAFRAAVDAKIRALRQPSQPTP